MTSTRKYDPQCDEIGHELEFRNFIVVNGPPCTGKTTLVKYVLDEHKDKYVHSYTLCDLVTSTTLLYTQIINDLTKGLKIKSNELKNKVVGRQDFVDKFDDLLKLDVSKEKKFIVVLDRPESFKKTPMFDAMEVMATTLHLKLVMITCKSGQAIIDECFKCCKLRARLQLNLSQFTLSNWHKDDLVEQICEFLPSKSPHLYKKFVNNSVQILYNTKTKNVIELKGICQDEFALFLESYQGYLRDFVRSREPETKDMSDGEVDRFMKKLDIPTTIETRFIGSFFESYRKGKLDSNPEDFEFKRTSFKMASLIVAAFVAAHSTPANDKRNFVKFQKRKQRSGKSDMVQIGSKTFSAERLLHIQKALENYSGIVDTDEASDISDADLLRVRQLERERIIIPIGADNLDTSIMYKLSKTVTRRYAQKLARTLELDLDNFYGLS